MNTRVEPRTVTLSAAQLNLFLRNAGAHGPLSPLGDFPASAGSPDDPQLLVEAGLIDAAGAASSGWRTAAETLVRPSARIVVSAGEEAGAHRLQVFSSAESDGKLVALGSAPGERISLAWPLESLDALAPLVAALALDGATFDPGVRLELSPEGFLMLAAALDALRELELEALLARDSAPALLTTASAMKVALKTGMSSDDMRWLTPVFRRLLPRAPEMTPSAIERGLGELVAASILTTADSRSYGLASSFEPVRRLLVTPLGWGAITAANEGRSAWGVLGAFRTFHALWGVELLAAKVRVATIGEAALLQAFEAMVGNATAPALKAQAPSAAHVRYCPHCGAAIQAGWKFCGACGKPSAA